MRWLFSLFVLDGSTYGPPFHSQSGHSLEAGMGNVAEQKSAPRFPSTREGSTKCSGGSWIVLMRRAIARESESKSPRRQRNQSLIVL